MGSGRPTVAPNVPTLRLRLLNILGAALLLDVLREDDLVDCINYI